MTLGKFFMKQRFNNVGVVILAAGKGKRMEDMLPLPKVLYPLCGRPMIEHLLNAVTGSVIGTRPVIVIAPDVFIIREKLGGHYDYAVQESQLGTGHAVLSAKDKLKGYDHVVVLYGDHPLITTAFLDLLVSRHLENGAVLTLGTVTVPDFNEWRSTFTSFARVLRDPAGTIERIVEAKDATDEERVIREVNPGYYIFKAARLWSVLPHLERDNAQGEYYLTDLLAVALAQEKKIETVSMQDPREGFGINTSEQLAMAETIMKERAQGPQPPLPFDDNQEEK